jgi:hypothetical protein
MFNSFTICLAQFLTIQSFDHFSGSVPYYSILLPFVWLNFLLSNPWTISLAQLLTIEFFYHLSGSIPYYPILGSSFWFSFLLFNLFTICLAQFLTIQSFDHFSDSVPYYSIILPFSCSIPYYTNVWPLLLLRSSLSNPVVTFSNPVTISLGLLHIILCCDHLSDCASYNPIMCQLSDSSPYTKMNLKLPKKHYQRDEYDSITVYLWLKEIWYSKFWLIKKIISEIQRKFKKKRKSDFFFF